MFKKKLSPFTMEMEYWIHRSEKKGSFLDVEGGLGPKYLSRIVRCRETDL